MQTDFQTRSKALETAFQMFNQVSSQLTLSYKELQGQVERLSGELAESRGERLRQLAEKERLAERLSKLLDALPAGVVLLDREERVSEFNPVARDLLGPMQSGDAWSGIRARAFMPGQEAAGELVIGDGRSVILTERRLDQTPGRIVLLQDVTEPRRLQARLERRERLSAMGEMAATLAHQIRTPLSSALLYVGHLARDDLSGAQREKFAGRLRERLQLMERQVNDMLAFSRGHGPQSELLNVSALLAASLQLVQPMAELRGSRLSLSDRSGGDVWLLGNPDALQGAFSNLIHNALEHGGNGVQVQVELARTTDGMVRIRFRDDGPGVPEDIRDQVFDPFFTTASDGTGLGLAVVQSVILAHRGRVELESGDCAGACFLIEVPLAEAPVGMGEEIPEARSQS
jgi:two-component system sensor histidine kinase FlrB